MLLIAIAKEYQNVIVTCEITYRQRGGNPGRFKSYPIKTTHKKSKSPPVISPSRLHNIRPHSSPKSNDFPATEPLPYRSATPSSLKYLGMEASRIQPDILRATPNNKEQRLYSFEGISSGQTYFSSRPPVDPMRIVFVGDPPEYCTTYSHIQCLFENQCKIEKTLSYHQTHLKTETEVQNTKAVTAFSSPTRRETKVRSRRKQSASSRTNNAAEKSGDAVVLQTWIHQLISSLPLGTTVALSDASSACILEECDSDRSEQVATTRNITNITDSPSRCSIAVQVLPNKCSSAASNCRAERNPSVLPEEWVGGVRALRDSHVRLVLRQLKHIDRLNRALDHAVMRPKPSAKHVNKNS